MALSLTSCLGMGCHSTPTVVETGEQEAMLPSLRFNQDLVKSLKPSNDRDWTPEQSRLATADVEGNQVTVHNIRNCHWRTFEDYDLEYLDRTYDLNKLTSVDFIVVPFNETPSVGHTMLSFGFEGKDYLAVSVEIRKERGENYNPMKGFFQQYEIMYVVAAESDVIGRRVRCDLCDVYVHHSIATHQQAKELFLDVMQRVNKLEKEPEFYDTLTNNCTTNIRGHINRLHEGSIPYNYHVLLPGYSDQLAYDLGLIDHHGSFEETRLHARVNYQACLYQDDPTFSKKIRR